ncbi:AraC family ligand binding domain-containing protein, partial [Streptomyces oceani]|uniref:AraC family ligand binding domain-containing protein n=1 Tax=Streptomyces oceani TaxID=1075402 RepID=UPI000B2800E4
MEETAEVAVPLHRLEVPAPQILPFAIGSFDSIGPMSRASFPHRHTFHEIVYVTGGRGEHVIDLCRRPVAPPNLCFIAPGQVHHWERARELTGWVVLFDDAFLLAHPTDRDTLRGLGERPWRRLDAPTAAGVAPLLAEMVREYQTQRPGMVSVLQAYLHILLVRAARPYDPPSSTPAGEPAGEPGVGPAQVGPSPAVA